jgi:hypothetical protein
MQVAALHALRLLYDAGKLNDHLQPVWITQRHSKQLGGWMRRSFEWAFKVVPCHDGTSTLTHTPH